MCTRQKKKKKLSSPRLPTSGLCASITCCFLSYEFLIHSHKKSSSEIWKSRLVVRALVAEVGQDLQHRVCGGGPPPSYINTYSLDNSILDPSALFLFFFGCRPNWNCLILSLLAYLGFVKKEWATSSNSMYTRWSSPLLLTSHTYSVQVVVLLYFLCSSFREIRTRHLPCLSFDGRPSCPPLPIKANILWPHLFPISSLFFSPLSKIAVSIVDLRSPIKKERTERATNNSIKRET